MKKQMTSILSIAVASILLSACGKDEPQTNSKFEIPPNSALKAVPDGIVLQNSGINTNQVPHKFNLDVRVEGNKVIVNNKEVPNVEQGLSMSVNGDDVFVNGQKVGQISPITATGAGVAVVGAGAVAVGNQAEVTINGQNVGTNNNNAIASVNVDNNKASLNINGKTVASVTVPKIEVNANSNSQTETESAQVTLNGNGLNVNATDGNENTAVKIGADGINVNVGQANTPAQPNNTTQDKSLLSVETKNNAVVIQTPMGNITLAE